MAYIPEAINMKNSNEVVNMVASTQYCPSLDINEVADELEIDYEQEQFPGMVYRVIKPKVCILLFRSGKAVATGAKSEKDIETAFKELHTVLKKKGFLNNDFDPKGITLQNIVVTHDYGEGLDLNTLVYALPFDKCEYEPEQFPGLIFRLDSPSAVCLIFSSGKCVITGCSSIAETEEAAEMLNDELNDAKSYERD